jgi:choline dehydrogenase-like flavoprotein
MHDKVDVLIIGSGASGAAVAWSLADTGCGSSAWSRAIG